MLTLARTTRRRNSSQSPLSLSAPHSSPRLLLRRRRTLETAGCLGPHRWGGRARGSTAGWACHGRHAQPAPRVRIARLYRSVHSSSSWAKTWPNRCSRTPWPQRHPSRPKRPRPSKPQRPPSSRAPQLHPQQPPMMHSHCLVPCERVQRLLHRVASSPRQCFRRNRSQSSRSHKLNHQLLKSSKCS